MSDSIRLLNTLAANGVVQNVVTGSQFEFSRTNEEILIAIAKENVANFTVSADVFFGPQLKISGGFVGTEVGAGQGPRLPDYTIVSSAAMAGDQLTITLRETGGLAGGDVVTFVQKSPL